MAIDCSGDWRSRYGSSAYANGVCVHVELTGESAESTEQAVRDAAAAGFQGGIGHWRAQQKRGGKNAGQTGGLGGSGAAVGGVSPAAAWGIGLAVVGAAWWFSSSPSSGRRR